MIVWVGCITCRTDERAKKWEGFWCDEEAAQHMTVYDVHQPGHLPDIDEHVVGIWDLSAFGVPLEQPEQDLAEQAEYADNLQRRGHLAPLAIYAMAKGLAIWDVDYTEFLARFAGEVTEDEVTDLLRSIYTVTPIDEGHYYIWRKDRG